MKIHIKTEVMETHSKGITLGLLEEGMAAKKNVFILNHERWIRKIQAKIWGKNISGGRSECRDMKCSMCHLRENGAYSI